MSHHYTRLPCLTLLKATMFHPCTRLPCLTTTQGCHVSPLYKAAMAHPCTRLPCLTPAQGCHVSPLYKAAMSSPYTRLPCLTPAQGCHVSPLYKAAIILLPRDPATHSISATTSGLFRGILKSDVIKYIPLVKTCDTRDARGQNYNQQLRHPRSGLFVARALDG